jgi:Transglycosylase SLT domain
MDKVTCFICALGLTFSTSNVEAAPPQDSSSASRIAQWSDYIAEAAQTFAIPDAWIRGVMQAESGGRTTLNGKPITSNKGAMGLMQIMPDTYRDLRLRYGLGANAYDPRDNIIAGAAYLRQMYQRYGYPSLFAAYNAGPKRVDDLLLTGRPLPQETVAYVNGIVPGVDISFATSSVPAQISPSNSTTKPFSPSSARSIGKLFFVHESDPATSHLAIDSSANAIQSTASLFVPLSSPAQ